MKYLALLRGINVGGNNIIKMADLRSCIEALGFQNVQTYIQSGNVIFETDKSESEVLKILEDALSKEFNNQASVVLRTDDELRQTIQSMPPTWNNPDGIRCYIAFVKKPKKPQDVLNECDPREGVDTVTIGPGVVYMSTTLEGITKSGINKLIGKKIYKEITMRNLNTTMKLLAMIETHQ